MKNKLNDCQDILMKMCLLQGIQDQWDRAIIAQSVVSEVITG